jgi:Lar family restriction alleviation protein
VSALELKPCPFCGGEATHRRFTGNGFTLARVEYTQVSCAKCQIETEPLQPLGSDDRAITAWNRRTPPAIRDDENHKATVERCAKEADDLSRDELFLDAAGRFGAELSAASIRSLIKEDGADE